MKRIIDFFAREHIIGNLITIFILAVGIYSILNIRRDIFPIVEYDVTTVRTILPGASPEQAEKLIINNIEEKLKEIDGIDEVRSTATESQALTAIKLDADARDITKTNSDIQNAIDQIDNLPEDAEKPIVRILESGLIPILEANITGPFNEFEIRKISKDFADEVALIDEVSKVTKLGYRPKEFLVSVDEKKLSRNNVSINQVIQGIKLQNISVPAGKISFSDGHEQLVRTEGQYANIEQIQNTQLNTNLDGIGVKLKDIATVKMQLEDPTRLYKANGTEAIIMRITKKINADALKLVKNIKATAEDFKKRFGANIEINFSRDMSVYLKRRLRALGGNLLIGLILVVLILTLFLPWQVTLVVSMGVPVALLGALAAAYMLGLSINLISLIGLIIVLGMLVDDAIVVSENIWSQYERTGDKMKSITTGCLEVLGPVTASILTTVSSFAPMLFMTGIFGAFIFQIPLMVIIALAFSMFEVFLIMPSHFSNWVREGKKVETKKENWFTPLIGKYKRYVAWSLRFRYLMLVAGLVVFFSTVGLVYGLGKFKLFSSDGVDFFFVKIEGPTSISLDGMSELIKPLEKIISELPKEDVTDYLTTIGIFQKDNLDPLTKYGNQFASIQVNLPAKLKPGRTINDIIADLEKVLVKPEGIRTVAVEMPNQGPPTGRDVSIDITGENFDVLLEIIGKIKKQLVADGLSKNIEDSFIEGKDEWLVRPKQIPMAASGVSVAQLSQSLRASFEGVVASSIRTLDEEINIRVKLKNTNTDSSNVESALSKFKVGNRRGNLTPIKPLTEIDKAKSLSMIQHLNFKRVINISAEAKDSSNARLPMAKIKPKVIEIVEQYPGYSYSFGGMDKDTDESMRSLFVSFLAAFFFIFSLLVVTFRSLLQPILILTSIPLGFVGALLAMLAHGRPFGFMSLLGTVALAGVIVNNSIVLTDFVNSCRKRGLQLSDSIVEAAGKRLRPIVLTTITTVSGLMPTAYGDTVEAVLGIGGSDPFIVPIALSLGWGLFIGSILTLVFFPCFIRILDDIENLFKREKSL